jgi:hypothetical protein
LGTYSKSSSTERIAASIVCFVARAFYAIGSIMTLKALTYAGLGGSAGLGRSAHRQFFW